MSNHKPLAQWTEAEKRAAVSDAFKRSDGARHNLPTNSARSDRVPRQR